MTEIAAANRGRFRILLTTLTLTPRFLFCLLRICSLAAINREATSRKADEYIREWQSRSVVATGDRRTAP